MKKTGALLLILILSISFVIAQNETNTTDTTPTTTQDTNKIDRGYFCLESKVKGTCSSLTTEEIAFTLLASPNSATTTECKNALIDKRSASNNCWPKASCTIKDTALAILALNNLGEDTAQAEAWLVSKTLTPTDLIWYLQQDSNVATQCKISAQGDENTINIKENKKIEGSAGSCFSLARSDFWLEINNNCYNTEFSVSCKDEFIASLLYSNQNSDTYYVLSNTKSAPGSGKVIFEVTAKCFGINSCNYEETVWTTLALLKKGYDIEEYIPYVVAMADSNKRYLPNAFIYMITNYKDYGTRLIEDKGFGDYWQAPSSSQSKFYDTAIALTALKSSSAEEVEKSKTGILFDQPQQGCWNNDIQDTAMILWALTDRAPSQGTGTTYCSEANYFCIPTAECPANEQFENYFCSGLSIICCMSENLQTCSEYEGQECASDKRCSGNERRASDTDNCCLSSCVDRVDTTGCEAMGYICRAECSANQESIDYECDTGICCRTKTTPQKGSIWIWILIIAIILVLAAIAYVMRDKLKLFFFKLKTKFKKEKPGPAPSQTQPPRPGFPPVRRIPQRRAPLRQPPRAGNTPIDNVFKKLKQMSS